MSAIGPRAESAIGQSVERADGRLKLAGFVQPSRLLLIPDHSNLITGTGGARRDRTDDLMLAKHALSQLSYGPVSRPAGARRLWWAWEDLNLRPHAYQARALTN